MSRQEVRYPYNVTVTRRENEGFGFVIISSLNKAGSAIGALFTYQAQQGYILFSLFSLTWPFEARGQGTEILKIILV